MFYFTNKHSERETDHVVFAFHLHVPCSETVLASRLVLLVILLFVLLVFFIFVLFFFFMIVLLVILVFVLFLRILLKQNTALLSYVRVLVCQSQA